MKIAHQYIIASFAACFSIGVSASAVEAQTQVNSAVPALAVQVQSKNFGSYILTSGFVTFRFADKQAEPSQLALEKACYSRIVQEELESTEVGRQFELIAFSRSLFQWTPSLVQNETEDDWQHDSLSFKLLHRETRQVLKAKASVVQSAKRSKEPGEGGESITRLEFSCSLINIDVKDQSGNTYRLTRPNSLPGTRQL